MNAMVTLPTVMRCKVCGSDNVRADATAIWNAKTQQWELAAVLDGDWCDDCEDDTVIIETTLEGAATVVTVP